MSGERRLVFDTNTLVSALLIADSSLGRLSARLWMKANFCFH
jgi:hypothetical protein